MDSTKKQEHNAMIRLRDLTVGYGDRHLIENANAEFDRGRLVALIGRNGAGKSTLLRALAGIDRPLSGSIEINGAALADMPLQQKARTVAFVTTQKVRIANMRSRDVVGMGRAPYTDWIGRLSAEDQEIVDHSLELVGMQDYGDRAMDRMSDGECQRVMIARALAQDTPVMLLDEPTSFLDLPNRYELGILLARLATEQRKCIVFSTHELDIALNICHDIALIDSPLLHVLPAGEMAQSTHLQRLFANRLFAFDPATQQMRLLNPEARD